MSWLQYEAGFFPCAGMNRGALVTFDDVLHWRFSNVHHYKLKMLNGKWIDGNANDASTIYDLRHRDPTDEEKLYLKGTLQCWQPSCVMTDKTKGNVPDRLNPILCLDFDHLEDWDIESLKQSIFDLPFVCYVSLSCSGKGLYALILIEEPDRLKDYAEHCFKVFQYYEIPVDIGKGQNPLQLRFVSYDANPLLRQDPKPLKIKRTNSPKFQASKKVSTQPVKVGDPLNWAVNAVRNANVGNRFETVRKASYLLGGYGFGLDEIKEVVKGCSQYNGVETKYLTHAEEGFAAGKLKPIT